MSEQWIDLTQIEQPGRVAKAGRWILRRAGGILSCLGCSVIFAIVLGPIFLGARESAKSPSCMSNVKQISLGALMYLQDHDERFMPAGSWMDLTFPYVKNAAVYRCVQVLTSDTIDYGYAYNRQLSKRLLKYVPIPSNTPLVYDSDQLSRNAFDDVSTLPNPGRHRNGNILGFTDGHVKWFQETKSFVPLPK